MPKKFWRILIFCLILSFLGISKKERGLTNAITSLGEERQIPKRSALVEEYHFPAILTKEAILASLPKPVFPEDEVFFFPDPSLNLGSTVKIFRAFRVRVIDGGKERYFRTFAQSVADFFKEAEIEIGKDDKFSVALDASIEDNLTIEIIRVEETRLEVKKRIPKEIVYKEDSELEKGKQKVIEEGKDGQKRQIFLVRRENGREVGRKLIEEVIEQPMVRRVILKGTKLPFVSTGIATWYYAPSLTAAHKSLPKGTIVLVTNLENQKSVKVTIADWGPVGAEIDLSKDAFEKIAPLSAGKIKVKIEKWLP